MMSILADALLIATGQTPAKRTEFYQSDRTTHATAPVRVAKVVKS